jgi:cellulose biosynthesis protein BcsQ
MSVISFMNGKGGVGKSALARTAAVEYARKENTRIILGDLNEGQHTCAIWAETRAANGFLPAIDARRMTLSQVYDLMRSPGECPDVLVLDTPGWKDKTSLQVAGWSTYVVIPCGGNLGDDVVPTFEFALQLVKAGLESWRMGIALTRLRAATAQTEMAEARRAFASDNEAKITVLDGGVRDMKSYADALSVGRALTETPLEALNDEAFGLIKSIDDHEYEATRKLQRTRRREREEREPARVRGRGR